MMRNKYFRFLCSRLEHADRFMMLLQKLHLREFYSIIPNDDNRARDGAELRNLFSEEVGPSGPLSLPEFECSMLEMLIGLANRLEFETAQSEWEKTSSEWFWILIDNLGFTTCDDAAFSQCNTLDKYIDQTLTIFLDRGYESNGNGGLFPIRNAEKDQRRVEIWYQMNSYVLENYPI